MVAQSVRERTVKPIQTSYKGYRFRSRLEARWAVFFDALGISWEYEPEGYRVGNRQYLPDFMVESQLLVEVKPENTFREGADVPDWPRWAGVARGTQRPLLAVFGPPTYPQGPTSAFRTLLFGLSWMAGADVPLVQVKLGACRRCGCLGALYDDSDQFGYELWCKKGCLNEKPPMETRHFTAAVEAARGARFEFGESGPEVRPIEPNVHYRAATPEQIETANRLAEIDRLIPLSSGADFDALIDEKQKTVARLLELGAPVWKRRRT